MDYCRECNGKEFVLWKDAFDRFPHLFECQLCGTLYEMFSGDEYPHENLPEDVRGRILKKSADA